MSIKAVVILIWTLVVMVVASIVGIGWNSAKVYKSTEHSFDIWDRDLQIDAEKVSFEAASFEKFLFLNRKTGKTITSAESTPPLGWEYDKYYVAPKQEIEGGKWDLEEGGVTEARVTTAPEPVTVSLIVNNA